MTIKRMPISESFAPPGGPHLIAGEQAQAGTRRDRHRALNRDDGTRQLLLSGSWTMLVAVLAMVLAAKVFGGFGPQGAHTNPGWLSLMVAMMSMPFALLLLLLGGAKWLRNLRLSREPAIRLPR